MMISMVRTVDCARFARNLIVARKVAPCARSLRAGEFAGDGPKARFIIISGPVQIRFVIISMVID